MKTGESGEMVKALSIIKEAEHSLQMLFNELEEIAYANQVRVIEAFHKHRVREYYFYPSTGYGYGDSGRDALEDIFAEIFGAEDALVRSQVVSGTHAISACLFALLRPGDELISLTGSPYDTLCRIIGHEEKSPGTLIDKGIKYSEVDLDERGKPDLTAIAAAIKDTTRMVLIQRSRGYKTRPPVDLETIAVITKLVKARNPATIVMLDNCYGEFTAVQEPGHYGVDIIAGSLIKNPGGGLIPSGGYIAGNKDLIEQLAFHLTAPGLGKELGASLLDKRIMYQGLFLAPHTVLQALKGAVLLAYVFEEHGYEVFPRWNEKRSDIVQAVKLRDAAEVLRFCQEVQNASPVDSDVTLEYGELPAYRDKIVMAAGTFVQGSSIELSCDAPLRSPHCVFLQGGLSYEHCRFLLQRLLDNFLLANA